MFHSPCVHVSMLWCTKTFVCVYHIGVYCVELYCTQFYVHVFNFHLATHFYPYYHDCYEFELPTAAKLIKYNLLKFWIGLNVWWLSRIVISLFSLLLQIRSFSLLLPHCSLNCSIAHSLILVIVCTETVCCNCKRSSVCERRMIFAFIQFFTDALTF